VKIEKTALQCERNTEIEKEKHLIIEGTFCIMDLLVIIVSMMQIIVKTSLNRA